MNGCPDCDARRKAQEDHDRAVAEREAVRRWSDQRAEAYIAGIVGGGMTFGLPVAWWCDEFGGPRDIVLTAMFIGVAVGIAWVYWRGDKFGTMKPGGGK